jgi:hypothetical protein
MVETGKPRPMRHTPGFGKTDLDVAGALPSRRACHEIHGNTLPHLHVHLFPRYNGDPFEDGPFNPSLIRESPYGPGEFESSGARCRRG